MPQNRSVSTEVHLLPTACLVGQGSVLQDARPAMPRQPLSKQEMSSPDGHKVTDNQSFKVPQRSAAAGLFPAYAGASGPQAAGWLQNASCPAMPAQPKAAPGTEEQEARSKLCKLMLERFTLVHDAVSGQNAILVSMSSSQG